MQHLRTLHENEEVVRGILDALPGGILQVDTAGAIVGANAEAIRILGIRHEELTLRTVDDFAGETVHEDGSPCPPTDYPVCRALVTGALDGPKTIGVRRPDGAVSWAVWRAVPLRASDGTITGAVVTFLDITERKLAEEALKQSEQKWRMLAENLPDFVCIADQDARYVSVNRFLSHLREEDVLGHKIYEFLEPSHVELYREKFNQTVEKRITTRLETRGQGPDRKSVWYETILIPVVADGAVRVLVVARDITERRAMIAHLAEKERLASVGMLAASVAHEIMNPLTYVLANLDFAMGERFVDDERRLEALGEAREGAMRMQQIVWDLRALGRAGADELFYVDARSVLETALRLAGPEVSRKANVILQLDEVPGVFASESRLCQVFINVLVNAAQAMDEPLSDERSIRVRTRHDESAGLVAIDISDTGAGIEASRLDRIFDPFYTTKRNGTGLGLSICRDIVERMGGKIDVASIVGRGTTFTVWLSTTRRPEPKPRAYASVGPSTGPISGTSARQ